MNLEASTAIQFGTDDGNEKGHDFKESAIFFPPELDSLEIDIEEKQLIECQINALRIEVENVLNREPSSVNRALSPEQKMFLEYLLIGTENGLSLSTKALIDLILANNSELIDPIQKKTTKALVRILKRTLIDVRTRTNPLAPPHIKKYYYHLALKEKPKTLEKEQFFEKPFYEMEDREWDSLTSIIDSGLTRLKSTAYIMRELLELLKMGSRRKKSLNKQLLYQRLYFKYNVIISDMEFNQCMENYQETMAEKFDEIGFEIMEEDGNLQAVLTKELDEIKSDYYLEAIGKNPDSVEFLRTGILETERHLRFLNFSSSDILFFMMNHRPCSSGEIIEHFRNKGIIIQKEYIQRLVNNIRRLNELDRNYSPIRINIYGDSLYFLVRSNKIYMEAVGDFSPCEKNPINSLYPKPESINFDFAYYMKIIEEKLPFIAYGESNMAIIMKILASFSVMQFKLSFSVLHSLLNQLKKEPVSKATFNACLGSIKSEINPILSAESIQFVFDGEGYYLKTKNNLSTKFYKFYSWADLYFQENFQLPYDFIAENEHLFYERPLQESEISPISEEMLSSIKRDLPYDFQLDEIKKYILIDEEERVSEKEIFKLINLVTELINGKMKKQKGEKISEIKQALLYILLYSTLKGRALLPEQVITLIGANEIEGKSIINLFNRFITNINRSPQTNLEIKTKKLATKVKGQNNIYYLGFKKR
ncbi:MAG: hypothetical protein RBS56_04210 [Candidatus Gracilibacteria bacterium]|jgi:hypothetical protein|nr:hypothetical protein [Candidatus Gracilibacteria bacterium]